MGLREEQSGERLHKPGPIQIIEREMKNETINKISSYIFTFIVCVFRQFKLRTKKECRWQAKRREERKTHTMWTLGLRQDKIKIEEILVAQNANRPDKLHSECPECKFNSPKSNKVPLKPRRTTRAFECVAIDLCGQ